MNATLLESLTQQLPAGTGLVGDDIGVRHHCDWTGRNPLPPMAVVRRQWVM